MTKSIDEYNEAMLAQGLVVLAATQRGVGSAVPGWVEGEPEFVRTTFLALIVECTELLQLFNWKQWKFPDDYDSGRLGMMAEEFADILAFLGYLVIWLNDLGITPDILAKRYRDKTDLNIKRLGGGVDGYGLGKAP